MRDHSRAVAGHLNGVHSGQEFWFSLEGPDVFPGRHRGLNALGEAFARLPGVSTISIPRRAPLFRHPGPWVVCPRISRSLSSGAHSRDPVAHAGYLLTWVADRPISEKRRPQRTFTNAPARARGHS